jgi:hypothetical protein
VAQAEAKTPKEPYQMAVNMREVSLSLWRAALGVLFLSVGPISAQPVQSTLQQRIEAAAKAALNSPRLVALLTASPAVLTARKTMPANDLKGGGGGRGWFET